MPSLAPLRARAIFTCLSLWLTLVAGSAHAAGGYAISYYSLPGMATTTLFDIDNDGRLLAWGRPTLDPADSDRSYLADQNGLQQLLTPTGQVALGRSFAAGGMIVGSVTDPTRLTPDGRPGNFGFISDPVAGWRQIESPVAGDPFVTVTGVSPNGRYISGLYTRTGLNSGVGQYRQDLASGQVSLVPSSVGMNSAYTVDNSGRLYGSSVAVPRQGLLYDADTDQLTVLPNLGFRSLLARAVNSSGLMAGSLSDLNGTGRAWVGSGSGVTVLDTRPGFATAIGINDLGQVVGGWSNEDGSEQAGFIATPVVLPEAGGPAGTFRFSVDVRADTPVFIDPLVAVGYDYAVGAGDPLFKTVTLPVGIGDGRYTLRVGDQELGIGGSQIVDFTALGFADGVAAFTVTGIETSAMLDPADASAFVTRLTFMADGRFTGTQTALTVDVPAVPEPGTWALWLLGAAALSGTTRQRRGQERQNPPR